MTAIKINPATKRRREERREEEEEEGEGCLGWIWSRILTVG